MRKPTQPEHEESCHRPGAGLLAGVAVGAEFGQDGIEPACVQLSRRALPQQAARSVPGPYGGSGWSSPPARGAGGRGRRPIPRLGQRVVGPGCSARRCIPVRSARTKRRRTLRWSVSPGRSPVRAVGRTWFSPPPAMRRSGARPDAEAWLRCCTARFLPVAWRVAGDDATARDALQESWIIVLEKLYQYRCEPPAFVVGSARSCATRPGTPRRGRTATRRSDPSELRARTSPGSTVGSSCASCWRP